jgi:hypothetical protein
VPANARFVELDHFDYVDPNVLCADVGRGRVQSGQVARWMYVRIAGTRIEGWVPWRATPRVVSCPKGGAGQAPPRG